MARRDKANSDEYDSPWKEALATYLPFFFQLFFPEIHAQLDWAKPHEFLDTQLRQLLGESEMGKREADVLVKLYRLDASEVWVLIHIEVQSSRDTQFAERMYVYDYRIFDRFRVPSCSLAVLADTDPSWRPQSYQRELFGFRTEMQFPIVKLLDLWDRIEELEFSANPFAIISAATLHTKRSKNNPTERRRHLFRLARNLYEIGYSGDDVRSLFNLIEWIMKLPKPDSIKFYEELKEFERRQPVPHINIAELVGYERGRKEERELAQKELKKELKKERERAEREKLAIARNLKGLGLEIEAIVEATGLPASEVEKL